MQKPQRRILEFPALFVFLSFLVGLSNFLDTFLRLLFSYMLTIPYPLGLDLKPTFFMLQAMCLIFFLYFTITNKQSSDHNTFRNLLVLQFAVLFLVVFLFFFYALINPGRYGVMIYYTGAIWLVSYILGPAVTSLWFFSKLLRESRYQAFSIVFLLIGLAFISVVIGEIYFWPQTLFNFSLPPEVDVGSRLLTTIFILLALFYTGVQLSFKKRIENPRTTLFKSIQLGVVFICLLIPFFLNYYKEGLFNMIIRAVVYWGLGYSGQDWYFSSLYLAALVVYLFLIIDLNKRLNQSLASNLILLGAVSLPWNGMWVFDFGYSSIPGNILSLDALIIGFLMLAQQINMKSRAAGDQLHSDSTTS